MSQLTPELGVIAHLNPRSPISESFRTLRTNILFSQADHKLQVLMITSSGPGEGKTTTITNLAVTYAQAEKRVVLIDCDMRKPMVHRMFQLSNREGISSVLTNQAELEEVICETDMPMLSVIPAGPIPPNPAELLGSKRMSSIIEQLRRVYDVILIDTPPVVALTDAQIVSTVSDGVILVIDAGKVKKEWALRAQANLDYVKANVIGVVLNNVNRSKKEAYYYNYYSETDTRTRR